MTAETLKQNFYLETLIKGSNPVLLLGDTGTGKTSVIKKLINNLTKASGWETGETVLSATTTACQVQKYFETCLEKHKKGVYGPKNPQN
jgi:dynein heavy chain, axonemal